MPRQVTRDDVRRWMREADPDIFGGGIPAHIAAEVNAILAEQAKQLEQEREQVCKIEN